MTESERDVLRKKLIGALETMSEEELIRIWTFIFSEERKAEEGESQC